MPPADSVARLTIRLHPLATRVLGTLGGELAAHWPNVTEVDGLDRLVRGSLQIRDNDGDWQLAKRMKGPSCQKGTVSADGYRGG